MKSKTMLTVLMMSLLLLIGIADANSPYGEMDVFYNGNLLPGAEVAKPTLKIYEPFTLRVDVTLYQFCRFDYQLSELGSDNFIVIDGPSKLGEFQDIIFMPNDTHIFEWTLKPTEEWAGGTMPINFFYSITVRDNPEPVVNSEFTIAVPYISTEHYEGDSTPPTTTTTDSPPSTESPNSIPAFTLITTALAIALAIRKQ